MSLATLYDSVDECKLCPLGRTRGTLLPLPGDGLSTRPKIMFIAINPSPRNATIQPAWRGRRLAWIPISGRRSKFWRLLIDSGLLSMNLKLEKAIYTQAHEPAIVERLVMALNENRIFLTELVKCPTKGQKDLTSSMLETCSANYLAKEIELVSPKVICTWGRLPYSTLTGCRMPLRSVMEELGSIKQMSVDDLPRTLPLFGGLPCYPCYFHNQAPISDAEKVRHLQKLGRALRTH